jgi:uncharacterized membrane-anchored protein YjiN (DUF445 family)
MFTVEQLSALGISGEEIKSGVVEAIKDVYDDVRKSITSIVAEKTSEWVAAALSKPIQPLNSWGEPKGDKTTIQALIEERAQGFMTEKVDSHGKAGEYRSETPRYLWAAQKVAEDALQKELRPSLDKVVAEMKREIQKGIAQVVSDLVARNFSR